MHPNSEPLDDGLFDTPDGATERVPQVIRLLWQQTANWCMGIGGALLLMAGFFFLTFFRVHSEEDRTVFFGFMLLSAVLGVFLLRFAQHLRAAVLYEDTLRLERAFARLQIFIVLLCLICVCGAVFVGFLLYGTLNNF